MDGFSKASAVIISVAVSQPILPVNIHLRF